MRFQIADEARCDIRRIAAYYTKVSGSNHRFLDRVNDAIAHLLRFPDSGHRRADLNNDSLLCWMIVPYVILYRIESDTLTIVGVVHASRDLARVTAGLYD